jgi:hypothetical protein
MSRPYVNINSSNYNSTTDVVTLDITALRLRGQSTITIGGFTTSQTITLSDGYYNNSSFTFSANINGTSSIGNSATSTFSPATSVFTFSGTASGGATKTNVKIQLWPQTSTTTIYGGGGYTFSSTQSTAAAVAELASGANNLPTGVAVSASGNSLIFTAPANTGAYFNGNPAKILTVVTGALGFTFSSAYYGGTWSGGVTTLTVPFSTTDFGTIDDSFKFDVQ